MSLWTEVQHKRPPVGVEVMTKIDDGNGVRNEQVMTLKHSLWWIGDMYVYYTPTHWREL